MSKAAHPKRDPAPTGPNVVLGVTGSIAAYKAADLCSQLVKAGCAVRVVMTADAQKFITPLPFKTLSRHAVVTDLYDEEEGWQPTHIRLADEADVLLIAPATANCLAKLAHGHADDALTCIALALNPKAKLLLAGARFIGPEEGMLSCGYEGLGRLWDVAGIVAETLKLLK